jgi:hypothetical protein
MDEYTFYNFYLDEDEDEDLDLDLTEFYENVDKIRNLTVKFRSVYTLPRNHKIKFSLF